MPLAWLGVTAYTGAGATHEKKRKPSDWQEGLMHKSAKRKKAPRGEQDGKTETGHKRGAQLARETPDEQKCVQRGAEYHNPATSTRAPRTNLTAGRATPLCADFASRLGISADCSPALMRANLVASGLMTTLRARASHTHPMAPRPSPYHPLLSPSPSHPLTLTH